MCRIRIPTLTKSETCSTKTRLLWGAKTLRNLLSKFLARIMKTFAFIVTGHGTSMSRSNQDQRLQRSNVQAPPSFVFVTVISDTRPRTEPKVEYNRNTHSVFRPENRFRARVNIQTTSFGPSLPELSLSFFPSKDSDSKSL